MTEEQTSPATDFLIAELQEINQEFRRTKEEGLNRLNFFIALTTSILGGLILLGQLGSILPDLWRYIAISALVFLLIVGWNMHQFTINRGISTDENVRAMARIRRYFVEQDLAILPYLTWTISDEPTKWVANNKSAIRRTTQIIVALIFALLGGLLGNFFTMRWPIIIGVGIISFVGMYQLLRLYANNQYKKAHKAALLDVRFPRQDENLPQAEPETNNQQAEEKT